MRVFLNATLTRKPYGGANSFLRSLTSALAARGVRVVSDIRAEFDVALINGLTSDVSAHELAQIRERGIPIVHRKVGYRERGSAELRRESDGVVEGDRRQIAFEPHLAASVFQSRYSYEVFRAAGYVGGLSQIIGNGVDPHVFGLVDPPRFFWQRARPRRPWDGKEPFRFAISTWSADASKGFGLFRELDGRLASLPNVTVDFVGRMPAGLRFERIRSFAPMRASALARFLRAHHGYLAFSEHESCSNALLEAISCGLHTVYVDSGAHREFAEPYGVAYAGSFDDAVARLLAGYQERLSRWPAAPFDIGQVAERYLALFASVLRPAQTGQA